MIEALRQDVRYASRHLRRSPAFTTAAVLTLALGIGINAGMFSILNALTLRQLPIHDPHGLIGVSGRNSKDQLRLTPIPAVEELSRGESPLQLPCAYNGGVVIAVEANGVATQAVGALVTGQCFATFGVAPMLGRPILDGDAPLYTPGSRVAVVGHRFWTRVFGADPGAVGKTIRTEGVELTVIGVLPPGFGGLHADSGVDLFAPFDTIFAAPSGRRPAASHILGRLRPGLSFDEATAQLTSRWPALLEVVVPSTLPPSERADMRAARPRVERLGTGISSEREQYARPLTIVMGLTAILLVLACANLGGLLLSRVAGRGPELAIRLALGGTRRRIVQQLLVESLLLSLGGAALAAPVSFAVVGSLASFLPQGLVERTNPLTPDLRVFGATAITGIVTGILMSVLPIWIGGRRQASARFTSDRTIAGTTSRWVRALLVAQVALSIVILVAAGLLIRSLYLLQRVDLGVRPEGILVVRVMPLPNAYRTIDNASYYPMLLEKLAALPGVRSVGYSRMFPRLNIDFAGQPIAFVGDPPGDVRAVLETVSPGFFATLGIPLVRGRLTSWSDNARSLPVAVVSERLARALEPDGNVIGRHVRFGSDRAHQDVVVVGVVGNATLGYPRRSDLPVFYRPALQAGRFANYPNVSIATVGDPRSVAAGVRQVLKEAGREYAHDISTLDAVLARAPVGERMSATLAGAIAALAVALALVGLHGMLAYTVSRRTREIGLRMALGAAPGAVIRTVLREGLLLTAGGVAIGLPSAFVAARALEALLFGVPAGDPLTFGATTALFLSLALAAAMVPARRAARLDPAITLRAE